jgi:8-oxo-dGTP pyrophosphatase MutT (NUDIX family)
MSKGRDAAGVLVVAASTGRVLLALRSSSVRNGGTWAVFGGGIDRGESLEEAAARELLEEAGLDYDEADFQMIHERFKDDGGVYTTFLLVVPKEVRARINHESDDYDWFDLDDLPEPLHPGAEALFDDVDVEELLDEW